MPATPYAAIRAEIQHSRSRLTRGAETRRQSPWWIRWWLVRRADAIRGELDELEADVDAWEAEEA